jgi:hypothetical protein
VGIVFNTMSRHDHVVATLSNGAATMAVGMSAPCKQHKGRPGSKTNQGVPTCRADLGGWRESRSGPNQRADLGRERQDQLDDSGSGLKAAIRRLSEGHSLAAKLLLQRLPGRFFPVGKLRSEITRRCGHHAEQRHRSLAWASPGSRAARSGAPT